jgi:aminoglycoside phosphotransferase family enzyme/predicted kinase
VPVTLEEDGALALSGAGRPIEWVVEMRRLPAARMLEQLIREGRVEPRAVDKLAARLAEFYASARRVALPRGELSARTVRHVRENRRELLQARHGLDRQLVERVSNRQLQLLAFRRDLFEERVASGRVVDGHGDLRPEHVCLEDEPVVFDCLEFNDELREVDVADDLGFFAMECERLGASWIAARVTSAYRDASGDPLPEELQAFYRAYRATVRAKVAALSARPGTPGDAARELAEAYLRLADRPLGRASEPLAVIFRGLTGSGKSTVAEPLAERLGARLVQTDGVRRQLFGPSPEPLAYGEGHYDEAGRARVYEAMLSQAADGLAARISVVVDACFLSAAQLRAALGSLAKAGGRPFVVHCVCPEAVARERIVARAQQSGRLSEATGEHYTAQKPREEPTPRDLPGLTLDTGIASPASLVDDIIRALSEASPGTASSGRWSLEMRHEPPEELDAPLAGS